MSDNLLFWGFLHVFLDFFEVQRCFEDCRAKFFPVQGFSWKGGHFPCKILFFRYFSNFQRLVRVRFASMTNKKPLGKVVCYCCHNLGYVVGIVGNYKIKIKDFNLFIIRNRLSLHLLPYTC